jgi:hypothetical protein
VRCLTLALVMVVTVWFSVGTSSTSSAQPCERRNIGLITGRATCETPGSSTERRSDDDTGQEWRKPGIPGTARVREPDELPDDRSQWNWNEIMYYSETQGPCWGINDPEEYLECQVAPWVESDDPTPTLTPEEAVEAVVAEIEFTAATPEMGPNREHHAFPFDTAVGYPIWLWADGGTVSRTVSETIGGNSVSISIRLKSVDWDLGDGTVLQCNRGTPWRVGTIAGSSSPTCGHVYTVPGSYNVVATSRWEIDWTAGGQSGTMNHSISASRRFDVGEIHVLIR